MKRLYEWCKKKANEEPVKVNMDNVNPPVLELAKLMQQPEKWEDKYTICVDDDTTIHVWLYDGRCWKDSIIRYSEKSIDEKFYLNKDEVYYLLPHQKLLSEYFENRCRMKKEERELLVRRTVGDSIKKVLEG